MRPSGSRSPTSIPSVNGATSVMRISSSPPPRASSPACAAAPRRDRVVGVHARSWGAPEHPRQRAPHHRHPRRPRRRARSRSTRELSIPRTAQRADHRGRAAVEQPFGLGLELARRPWLGGPHRPLSPRTAPRATSRQAGAGPARRRGTAAPRAGPRAAPRAPPRHSSLGRASWTITVLKSSPPSRLSPAEARTSTTPSNISTIETSNVPPPRSNTRNGSRSPRSCRP